MVYNPNELKIFAPQNSLYFLLLGRKARDLQLRHFTLPCETFRLGALILALQLRQTKMFFNNRAVPSSFLTMIDHQQFTSFIILYLSFFTYYFLLLLLHLLHHFQAHDLPV